MLFCICYDIANDRRRRKVEKVLKQHGVRVQESVFEVLLDEKGYQKLKAQAERAANLEEDNLRYYRLCKACRSAIEVSGVSRMPLEREDILVV